MNSFPQSSYSMECNSLIDDLRERLEKKYFDIAKGYFHRENYSSAVTSFNVMLGEYPDTKYREEALVLRFKSQSFLQQQVRSMVGCLKYLGENKWDLIKFNKVIKSKKRNLWAPPAPAEGLFLEKIIY